MSNVSSIGRPPRPRVMSPCTQCMPLAPSFVATNCLSSAVLGLVRSSRSTHVSRSGNCASTVSLRSACVVLRRAWSPANRPRVAKRSPSLMSESFHPTASSICLCTRSQECISEAKVFLDLCVIGHARPRLWRCLFIGIPSRQCALSAAGVGWQEDDEVDYDLSQEDREWLGNFNRGQERLPFRRLELLLWRLDTANAEATESALLGLLLYSAICNACRSHEPPPHCMEM